MKESTLRFPQVLLLGNGLNRSYGDGDWKKLLEQVKTNPKINLDNDVYKKVPYPLLAVLATDDHVNTATKNRNLFCGASDEVLTKMRPYLQRLLTIGFDEILTTNYSYELERVACPNIDREGKNCSKLMKYTAWKKGPIKAEAKYLLHTYNAVTYQGVDNRIWHIHGEARKPNSMILGHYYYGALLQKWQELLEKRKNYQNEREQQGLPPIMTSWLDAFILGDVYVLGFGYDFSEMDLWWLLNRKKREKASHGTLHFYEPLWGNEIKFALMESYGATTECLGFRQKIPNYEPFYQAAIADIQSKVQGARKGDHDLCLNS